MGIVDYVLLCYVISHVHVFALHEVKVHVCSMYRYQSQQI